jgi:hypothetical protein
MLVAVTIQLLHGLITLQQVSHMRPMHASVGLRMHAPELEQPKSPAPVANPLLSEEHRPAGNQLDEDRHRDKTSQDGWQQQEQK